MGKLKTGIASILVLYVLYSWILFKPPRKGWDFLAIKITVWILATVLFIVVFAGYWALFKEE
jgi:hypothetical protein